jgi:hypothetical protein
MSRFILFAGGAGGPKGGANDRVDSFPSSTEAATYGRALFTRPGCNFTWFHVFDIGSSKITTSEQLPNARIGDEQTEVFRVSFWCLYDADADKKYFKKSLADGSLAIFDEEHEAISAKCLGDGHMKVEYVKASDYDRVKEERDRMRALLREVHATYRAAIHWEDLGGAMKRIGAVLTEPTK